MRNWLIRYLGVAEINQQLVNMQYDNQLTSEAILKELRILTPALGRIIAKLDPAYVADPHSPKTQQASDEIGDLAIRRLKGEHEARNKWDPK